MNFIIAFLMVLFTNFSLYSQTTDISISGKINGTYPDKIFLFFDGNINAKDSLSSVIANGYFQFNLKTKLPILCRLHFSENTNIVEFYIDNPTTLIFLNSKIETNSENKTKRTYFQLDSIKGSVIEVNRQLFEKSLAKVEAFNISTIEKRNLHYNLLDSFITKNPKSKHALYFLATNKILSLNQINLLKSNFDTSLLSSYEGQKLNRSIISLLRLKNRVIGGQFHHVSLPDIFGKKIETSIYTGKIVLINFWASWCAPCREKHPEVVKLFDSYNRSQFDIIGISFDDNLKSWRAAVVKDKIKWLQLIDTKYTYGTLSSYYDIKGVPSNILINRDGKILGFDLTYNEIKKIIDNNLK